MAIRFLLGNMFKTRTLQGERIAPRAFPSVTAPVCATSRNDREIGAWFLKLMTLPPRGKVVGERPVITLNDPLSVFSDHD